MRAERDRDTHRDRGPRTKDQGPKTREEKDQILLSLGIWTHGPNAFGLVDGDASAGGGQMDLSAGQWDAGTLYCPRATAKWQ